MEKMIADSVQAHLPVARRMDVALAGECQPGLPLVWFDELQIGVVLRNLVANAIESAAGAPGDKRVSVRAGLDGGILRVEVLDSGPGVQASRLATLFDAAPSTKPGGLGVGLSICRAIMEAHGGKLWAEPGPGGHFFFTLPIEHHEPSTDQQPS